MFGSKRKRQAQFEAAQTADLRQFMESMVDSDLTVDEINNNLTRHLVEKGWARAIGGGQFEATVAVDAARVVSRLVRLAEVQRGEWEEAVHETSMILRPREEAYAEEDAVLLKEVAQREFRGGSQGLSIPIGAIHGRSVRYRVGAYRGHMVTVGTNWVPADTGTLTVTNQRIVFRGARKTLEFQFNKLISLQVYADAVELGVSNRQTTSSFTVEDPVCLAGIIRATVEHSLEGTEDPKAHASPPVAPRLGPSAGPEAEPLLANAGPGNSPTVPRGSADNDGVPPSEADVSDSLSATIDLDPPGPGAELRITLPGQAKPLVFRWRDDDFMGGDDAHILCHGFDIGDHRNPLAIPGCVLFQLAGGTYHPEEMRKHSFAAGRAVVLIPEPDNPHDANAIAVWNAERDASVGYVPHSLSRQLAATFKGDSRGGLIVQEWKRGHQRVGLTILTAGPIRQSDRPALTAARAGTGSLAEQPPETPDQSASSDAERSDPLDRIRRLGELRDQGFLTEEEFATKKAELLRQI